MKEELVNEIIDTLRKSSLEDKISCLTRGLPYDIVESLEGNNIFFIMRTIEETENGLKNQNNKEILEIILKVLKDKLVFDKDTLIKSIDAELENNYSGKKTTIFNKLFKLVLDHKISLELASELSNYIEENY